MACFSWIRSLVHQQGQEESCEQRESTPDLTRDSQQRQYHRLRCAYPHLLPVINFLSSPHFLPALSSSSEAWSLLRRYPTLLSTVTNILGNPLLITAHLNSVPLRLLVEHFADPSLPLPTGWMIREPGPHDPFYHIASGCFTHFDPRLPYTQPTWPSHAQLLLEFLSGDGGRLVIKRWVRDFSYISFRLTLRLS